MLRHTLHLIVIATLLTFGPSAGLCAQDSAPSKDAPKADTAKDAGAAQPSATAGNTPGAPATPAAPATSEAAKVSTEAKEPEKIQWPFDGMTGYVDKQAAQRGFQIYSQVCSACHSMNLITYRNLEDLGFSAAEVKAIASQKQVADFNDKGEAIQRPGKPFDRFVAPFPNKEAAAAANGGAAPPDLSLIIKARAQGPDYVHSILTGFSNPPANEPPVANKYYNPYFQNHWISMPPPLHDGVVSYEDGTNASVDQMARDVVVFLQWASEPEMQARHEMGFKVLIFLLIAAVFFYIAKRRVWKDLH